jgi:hypothetical protein
LKTERDTPSQNALLRGARADKIIIQDFTLITS